MANNCVANFRITATAAAPLQEIADILNSLREKFPEESVDENWFGQNWLGNLATLLGHDTDTFDGEMRGYIDQNFWLFAEMSMCGATEASKEPFKVEKTAKGYELTFSVVSAWGLPSWVLDWFLTYENKYTDEMVIVSYKATDEFNDFHTCRHPEVIGGVYEIDHASGDVYDFGQEQMFLENISRITGIPLTEKMKKDAESGNFREILSLVDKWNEDQEDEECYIFVYKENKK